MRKLLRILAWIVVAPAVVPFCLLFLAIYSPIWLVFGVMSFAFTGEWEHLGE